MVLAIACCAGIPLAAQTAHAGGTVPISGGFSYPQNVAVDGRGNVFVADYSNNPLKEIVANNLNAAALLEREDIAKGDKAVQSELESKGLAFNVAETQSFRDGLKTGGFYKEWRAKLGEEPWGQLEKYAGSLG